MLNEVDKRRFIEMTVLPKMADYTMPYLSQVFGVLDDRSGEYRGTGFFCEIEGVDAVVCAGHTLQDAENSGRYCSLAFSRSSGLPPGILPGKIIHSSGYDLSVYLPDCPFPVGAGKRFWPGRRIDRSLEGLPRDYLFLQGFPQRFSRTTALGGAGLANASESLAYGAMMRYRESDIPSSEREQFDRESPDYPFIPEDFLKEHEFALNFEADPTGIFLGPGETAVETRQNVKDDWAATFESAGAHETLPGTKTRGAFGLSGSPVWRIGAAGRSAKDWTAEWCELVGIVTCWNAERKLLVATFASKLFELVGTAKQPAGTR
jgi:hypothetical protein